MVVLMFLAQVELDNNFDIRNDEICCLHQITEWQFKIIGKSWASLAVTQFPPNKTMTSIPVEIGDCIRFGKKIKVLP